MDGDSDIGDEGHNRKQSETTNIFKKYGHQLDFETYFKSLCEQVGSVSPNAKRMRRSQSGTIYDRQRAKDKERQEKLAKLSREMYAVSPPRIYTK